VFTLSDKADVQELAQAVEQVTEQAVNVFQLIQQGRGPEIHHNMELIARLCAKFIPLCQQGQYLDKAQETVSTMDRLQRELSTINGRVDLSPDNCQHISSKLSTFLGQIATICDLMEAVSIDRYICAIEEAKEKAERLHELCIDADRFCSMACFESRLVNVQITQANVQHLLTTRINVADQGSHLISKFEQTKEVVEREGKAYQEAARACFQDKYQNKELMRQEHEHLSLIADAYSKLITDFKQEVIAISSESKFSYEVVTEALENLQKAVQCADSKAITAQAKLIAAEAATASDKEFTDKTKDLLRASVMVIKQPSERAEEMLGAAIASLQGLATPEDNSGNAALKNKLRLATIGIGKACEDLVYNTERVPKN